MSERLEKAVIGMRASVRDRERLAFALPDSRFHMRRREALKVADARHSRKFVHPENALALIAQLPQPHESLHAILRGDFVIGDMLPLILAATGATPFLRVATLGLSVKNAETLRDLATSGQAQRILLLCSHYFRSVEKIGIFHQLTKILEGVAEIKVARCHAKIILIPTAAGDFFVMETSANLRSSDSVEQITVFNDRALHDFHAAWMDEIKPHESRAPKKVLP